MVTEALSTALSPYKGGSWFEVYSRFLTKNTPLFWSQSPIPFERLEQINLTRNDATHDWRIETARPHRTDSHIRKHPVSIFADEWEVEMLEGSDELPLQIRVTRENLGAAIEDVRSFCNFVESQRTK